jgi:hypothetical protein
MNAAEVRYARGTGRIRATSRVDVLEEPIEKMRIERHGLRELAMKMVDLHEHSHSPMRDP